MEQKIEREWKSIGCPEGEEKTMVICEREIVSGGGRIFRRSLKQIDCRNPKLTGFGGTDCNWSCEKVIVKREYRDL